MGVGVGEDVGAGVGACIGEGKSVLAGGVTVGGATVGGVIVGGVTVGGVTVGGDAGSKAGTSMELELEDGGEAGINAGMSGIIFSWSLVMSATSYIMCCINLVVICNIPHVDEQRINSK